MAKWALIQYFVARNPPENAAAILNKGYDDYKGGWDSWVDVPAPASSLTSSPIVTRFRRRASNHGTPDTIQEDTSTQMDEDLDAALNAGIDGGEKEHADASEDSDESEEN